MDTPKYAASASTRHVRLSTQKARLVADLIRKRPVGRP